VINNVHILFTVMDAQVANTAQTMGYSPCVSHLSDIRSTYERWYSRQQRWGRGSPLGYTL